jgi:DNA-binding LytR/AlgR family response regulator
VKEHEPDLITLDIELEDLSGVEVAQQIRCHMGPDPQIIFVTGSTAPLDIMTAVNEIGAYYIVKPLQQDRWKLAVDKIVELHARSESSNSRLPTTSPLIHIQASRKTYPITEESILMIEKENSKKSVNIYLRNGEVLTSNSTIQQIKSQTTDLIFETLRGFLVNIRHVSGVTKEALPHDNTPRRFTVYFKGTTFTAPLGRFQEKEFIEQLQRFNSR